MIHSFISWHVLCSKNYLIFCFLVFASIALICCSLTPWILFLFLRVIFLILYSSYLTIFLKWSWGKVLEELHKIFQSIAISKQQNELYLFPRQTIQYHSNPIYAPTSNTEEAEVEWFYEDLQDILELTPQKRCPFHYRGLEWKSRKSRNTWGNRHIWPCSTEWSRARLKEFSQENALVIANTPLPKTQEKTLHMDTTRWPIAKSDWLYSLQPKMETLYTVSKNKTRS